MELVFHIISFLLQKADIIRIESLTILLVFFELLKSPPLVLLQIFNSPLKIFNSLLLNLIVKDTFLCQYPYFALKFFLIRLQFLFSSIPILAILLDYCLILLFYLRDAFVAKMFIIAFITDFRLLQVFNSLLQLPYFLKVLFLIFFLVLLQKGYLVCCQYFWLLVGWGNLILLIFEVDYLLLELANLFRGFFAKFC